MYPSDTQLEELMLPPGTLVDTSTRGTNVTAAGKPARILGIDSEGNVYCAFLHEEAVMFGAYPAAQVVPA